MYIDAHIHLYDAEYKEIINDIIEEAFNHGIKYIVSVSEDSVTAIKNLGLSKLNRNILIGLGVHPWTAIYNPGDIDKTIEIILEYIDEIVCIGEVGLDKKYEDSIRMWDKQVDTFNKMISLALEYKKPLNIHSRRAARDVLHILNKRDVDQAYFHWYTDDLETLKNIIQHGYYIGFTPSITYSKRVKKLAYKTPLENILTETDGPVRYYGPLKDEITKPSHVTLIINEIARIKDMDPEYVAREVYNNFIRFYFKK